MKHKKNKTAEEGGIAVAETPKKSGPAAVLNNDFNLTAQKLWPDEFNEPEDQDILRAVWMAATVNVLRRIRASVMEPMLAAAEGEYKKVTETPPPITPA